MSIFNKPYKTDEELELDVTGTKRRAKMRTRIMRNTLADKIFRAVITKIDGGIDNFSKEEMIRLVAGEAKISAPEWIVWDKASTIAIAKINRYYWGDKDNPLARRAFNYVRDMNRYWLIPINAGRAGKLAINVVYEERARKILGQKEKQDALKTSVYAKMLELDVDMRKALIQKLREDHLLNGDTE